MIFVIGLVWDEWNREHLARHQVSQEEVEEVCQNEHTSERSFKKRILIIGKTKIGRDIAAVLSPEDKNSKPYGQGIYYVITAFEREVKK